MLPFDLCTRVSVFDDYHCLCSPNLWQLRNGTRARLRQVVLPYTNQNLAILSLLLKHGFISSVGRGSDTDCDPAIFKDLPVSQQRLWADMKYRQNRPILGMRAHRSDS